MEYILAPKAAGPCIFCGIAAAGEQELRARHVLCRGERAYVMLNLYPYAAGHLLIMPYAHRGDLTELDDADTDALFRLTREAARRLRAATRCEGMNVGINLGRCAGSSIREHVHVQIVPRWEGDTNFMAVTGDTRVIPQALDETWHMLRPHFADLDRAATLG
jgi:ATP adenylyltransferase